MTRAIPHHPPLNLLHLRATMSRASAGPSDGIIGNYSGACSSPALTPGPWFSTQLILSLAIGVSSFLLFCVVRTRWQLVYMPRTKLKGG